MTLLFLVVVPLVSQGHFLFPQALQALVVNLNACGRCRTRCVVSEDIAHVVQQPRGGQQTENTPQGPALTTIEAEDVNACFAWLESRDDVEVLLGLTDTWYGDRIFQICDEEKNVVEVLAYRRNMKNRDTLPQEDPS